MDIAHVFFRQVAHIKQIVIFLVIVDSTCLEIEQFISSGDYVLLDGPCEKKQEPIGNGVEHKICNIVDRDVGRQEVCVDEEKDKVEEQRDVTRKVRQWCAWLFGSDALNERHDHIAVHENLQQVVPVDKERVLPCAQALVRAETPDGKGDLAAHQQHRHNHGELGHSLVVLDQNLELLVIVKI